jgi:hypothetical protein
LFLFIVNMMHLYLSAIMLLTFKTIKYNYSRNFFHLFAGEMYVYFNNKLHKSIIYFTFYLFRIYFFQFEQLNYNM